MSILKQMRKNPAMTASAFIFVIALIAVIGWIVNMKKGSTGSTGGVKSFTGPKLEVSAVKSVKSVNTSGYEIEYDSGDDILGYNIDFTVMIRTKGGFEENNITTLKIIRYSNGEKIQEHVVTGVNDFSEYSHTFLGEDLVKSVVPSTGGKNKFTVDAGGDDNKYIGENLAEAEIYISPRDLDYSFENALIEEFTFTVDDDSTTLGIFHNVKRTVFELSITPGVEYILTPDNATGGYRFREIRNEEVSPQPLTVDSIDTFKINKYGGKYRLISGDKLLTRQGGDGVLVLKKPSAMTSSEADMASMTVITSALRAPSPPPAAEVAAAAAAAAAAGGVANPNSSLAEVQQAIAQHEANKGLGIMEQQGSFTFISSP